MPGATPVSPAQPPAAAPPGAASVLPLPGGSPAPKKPPQQDHALAAVVGDASAMHPALALRTMLRGHMRSKLAAAAAVALASPLVVAAAACWSALLDECEAEAPRDEYVGVVDCGSPALRAAWYLLENAGLCLMLTAIVLTLRVMALDAGVRLPRASVALGALTVASQGANAAVVAARGYTEALYFCVNYPACIVGFVGGAYACRALHPRLVSLFALIVVGFVVLMIAFTWVIPPAFLAMEDGGRLVLIVAVVPALLELALLPVREVSRWAASSLGASTALMLLPCMLVNVVARFLLGSFDSWAMGLVASTALSAVELALRGTAARRDAALCLWRGIPFSQQHRDACAALAVVLRFSEEVGIALGPLLRLVYRMGAPGEVLATAAAQWVVEAALDAAPAVVACCSPSSARAVRLRARLLLPDVVFARVWRGRGVRDALVVATVGLVLWLADESLSPFEMHCPERGVSGGWWEWGEC